VAAHDGALTNGDVMSRRKKRSLHRFETGGHGGCEALLFEFRRNLTRLMDEKRKRSAELSEQDVVTIAARTFDEALEYLRWREPDFAIDSVQNLGFILMVSGSAVD
jgi:hypothetical protein